MIRHEERIGFRWEPDWDREAIGSAPARVEFPFVDLDLLAEFSPKARGVTVIT